MSVDLTIIRFKLVSDSRSSGGSMYIEFDCRLQYEGSDVSFYTNTWDRSNTANLPPYVFRMLDHLLNNPRSGVERVIVKPFKMIISCSSIVASDQILNFISDGIQTAGYTPEEVTN